MDIQINFSCNLQPYNEVVLSFRLTINYRDIISFTRTEAPNYFNYGAHYVWVKNAYCQLNDIEYLLYGNYLPECRKNGKYSIF